jgi:hypothetical protein
MNTHRFTEKPKARNNAVNSTQHLHGTWYTALPGLRSNLEMLTEMKYRNMLTVSCRETELMYRKYQRG